MTDGQLLHKNAAWLFASGAAAVGIAITLALAPLAAGSWRTTFGVIAGAVVLLGGASTKLTAVSSGGAIGRFAVAGAVVGAAHFWYAHHLIDAAVVVALVFVGGLTGTLIGASLRKGCFGTIPASR